MSRRMTHPSPEQRSPLLLPTPLLCRRAAAAVRKPNCALPCRTGESATHCIRFLCDWLCAAPSSCAAVPRTSAQRACCAMHARHLRRNVVSETTPRCALRAVANSQSSRLCGPPAKLRGNDGRRASACGCSMPRRARPVGDARPQRPRCLTVRHDANPTSRAILQL